MHKDRKKMMVCLLECLIATNCKCQLVKMCRLGIAVSASLPVVSANFAKAALRNQVGVISLERCIFGQSREVLEVKVMFVQRCTFLLYFQTCPSGESAWDDFFFFLKSSEGERLHLVIMVTLALLRNRQIFFFFS